MARFNEILAGRYNRFLQKLFVMKGGPPVPQLGGEVMPNIPLFSGAENRYLESWELFAIAATVVATAGQTNTLRLRNPTGSNVIAVVEKLTVASAAAQEIEVSLGTAITDFTALAAGGRDFRDRALPTLVGSTSVASQVPLGTRLARMNVTTAGPTLDMIWDENQEAIVFPGSAIQIDSTVVNTSLVACIWWRERALEDSEIK